MRAVSKDRTMEAAEKQKASFFKQKWNGRKSKGQDDRDQPNSAAELNAAEKDFSNEKSSSKTKVPKMITAISDEQNHAYTFNEAECLKPSKLRQKNHVVLKSAPPACVAAYSGPPRYDWIDIETNAAIKVQAAYRRNKVYWDFEKEGKSTAWIRSESRRRKAKQRMALDENAPNMFACCGVGLLFGDTMEEDGAAVKQYEKDRFLERKAAKAMQEEALRRYRPRKKAFNNVSEAVEVVEDLEERN